ncbi:MAG: hypothetical protein Q8922_14735 [Bacteroidota bacterium]|nr:hypothetical protein [Bacteroidota bacterium]MDP4234533.1 hypothetical protein [Bacteroidota bacterium]MDP4242598.1 hypothetical protein [Bacteroidota bacterium]MDP4289174.1 hypothetical protein [Bacteroidota bacterium]
MNPYIPILGSVITAAAAWFAITRRIRYSVLHEKRAQVLEHVYANALELSDSMRMLGYDWISNEDLRKQLEMIRGAKEKITLQQKDALYLNRRTSQILFQLQFHAMALCFEFDDAMWPSKPVSEGGGWRTQNEVEVGIAKVRKDAEVILKYQMPKLMDNLKYEFQKLLGVESKTSRMAYAFLDLMRLRIHRFKFKAGKLPRLFAYSHDKVTKTSAPMEDVSGEQGGLF